jgi:3-dehydroquinate dehydratase
MTMYKICTPVIGSTLAEFINNLEQIQTQSNFVELRLECIQGLTLEDLNKIQKALKVKAIVSCNFDFDIESELRLAILAKCLQLDFDYVDIELIAAKRFCLPIKNPKNKAKKKHNQILQILDTSKLDLNQKSAKTQLILSYHNFESTNNYRFLRKIQDQMKGFGCDIQKIVCQVHTNHDLQILTRVLVSRTESEKLVVLGLGNLGKFLGIQGLLLGNYLTLDSSKDFLVQTCTQSYIQTPDQTSNLPTMQEIKTELHLQ